MRYALYAMVAMTVFGGLNFAVHLMSYAATAPRPVNAPVSTKRLTSWRSLKRGTGRKRLSPRTRAKAFQDLRKAVPETASLVPSAAVTASRCRLAFDKVLPRQGFQAFGPHLLRLHASAIDGVASNRAVAAG